MFVVEFYTAQPTATTSWRLAVLMGVNTRTYKFALADALLHFARQGREEVRLSDLAAHYSVRLVQHLADAPQAPAAQAGENDFLALAQADAELVATTGRASERLVAAAMDNMPGMVAVKFHNLRSAQVPHRFYELTGRGRSRQVILTPDLRQVANAEDGFLLDEELGARWNIVETSFATGVGASLIQDGLLVDLAEEELTGVYRLKDVARRRSVAGVREAVVGFQHGRCLLCDLPLTDVDAVAVDHTIPLALMRRAGWVWRGPDLDAVWNLAPAHYACNALKNDAPPGRAVLTRLAQRNAAIMDSPHPLKVTLRGTLRRAGQAGTDAAAWMRLFDDDQLLKIGTFPA